MPQHHPVGVIDIGSNTIRLVVFGGRHRTPLPLFNEKATCALGAGLEGSGRLNPEGVPQALAAVERFVALARAMEVERLDVLATAACRDAEDGAAFLAEIERRCGITVTLLSGEEEATRAALGVLCSIPDADGMVADVGGGSLELITVKDGRFGRFATMPLGLLRLSEHSGGDRERALAVIEQRLAKVDFMEEGRGRHLYAVGGSWRALARVLIDQMNYPLHVLDNFTLPRAEAERLIGLIARQSRKSLDKVHGVSKKRLPMLPLSALLLERLLQRVQPDAVVFSVYGMREGQFYLGLDEEMKRQDPLIASASRLAEGAGRFPEHGHELMEWMSPLFPDEAPELRRLRHAACLLGDIFWYEHPDFRAEQAFLRVLRLPFMGLGHRERAGLALAVYYRYASDEASEVVRTAHDLLDDERIRRVRTIGAALRLGHTVSGGAAGLLSRTRLTRGDTVLMLGVPAGDPLFNPEAFSRRLDRLAQELGLTAQIAQV
ncbi:exopolyphosphatase [Novispirillum sp. DQ9]|uniref:Ppx/GppA phosphatase family protein n=1 Tax=Novispirillum sp. DQ9 TaxID=3398612 RepID=UPI003C79CA72